MALVVEGLTKEFGGLRALEGVSFRLEPGMILGLIGPNGAGKTTCFNLITGFATPTGGSVSVDGIDMTGAPPYVAADQGVTRTFQQTSVFNKLTAFENVRIGLHRHRRASVFDVLLRTPRYRLEEEASRAEVLRILETLGLHERAWTQAGDLAYGEQKRLALAIALASRPRYLLLDEPAAGLNAHETGEMTAALMSLRQQNFGILLVEHDVKMVMSACDHIVVLASGRQLAAGTPADVRSNAKVIEAYLGRQR